MTFGLALCLPIPGRIRGTMSGEAEKPKHKGSLGNPWVDLVRLFCIGTMSRFVKLEIPIDEGQFDGVFR
jgi:hypothetical protein